MNAFVQPKTISIRASSLADLFDCPARWEAKNILNMTKPTGGRSRLGTAIHEAVTQWDYLKMIGGDPFIDDCLDVVNEQIWQPNEEVDWSDIDQNDAEKIAHSLMQKYIEVIAPTQKFVGIEVRCEPIVLTDLGIELTGTIDRIYEDENGDLGIGDIKTGKSSCDANGVVKTSGHATQMGVYTILASQALQEPVIAPARIYGLTTGKTDAGQHIGIGEIESPATVLLGTEESTGLLHHAAQILKHGIFYGNPKSVLCSEKFCPKFSTCNFRK